MIFKLPKVIYSLHALLFVAMLPFLNKHLFRIIPVILLTILAKEAMGQFTEKLVDRLTVHFENDSYTLDEEYKAEINEFIRNLDVVIPYVFRIQGHTDSIGSVQYNQRLSNRRSNTIKDYLLDLGIPEKLISLKGIGEMKPIKPNSEEEGRAYNRRANIFVFEIQKYRLFRSKVILSGNKDNKAAVYIQTDEGMDSTFTDDKGNFAFVIPENKNVTYGIFAKGYMFSTRTINTSRDLPIGDIVLNRIKPGEKVSLNNLYFVGDQAILLPESQPELVNLTRFARNNPGLKLEIGGHVNGPKSYFGNPKWYYDLALNRTKTIKEYLDAAGINTENYVCKSYSNTQMVNTEPKNEAEAKMNRRVEIKILE